MTRATTVHRLLPAVAAAAIVIATMAWPGDIPWGGDEVLLTTAAARANAAHRLVTVGLTGSYGLPYGPVPCQVYQILLAITHDVPTLVRLRAGLTAGTTAAALLWLAATLGWTGWLAPLAMLSPFFWFYARLIWDNTFAIPVGATLVAAYAAHLAGRRGLTVAVAAAAVLPLIHPMTLPLAAVFAGHMLWRCRPALARQWRRLSVLGVVLLVSSGPYLVRAAGSRPGPPAETSDDGYRRLSRPAAFAFPAFNGRLLSGFRFFDFRGPEHGWETTPLGIAARSISVVAFPLVVIGWAVLLWRRTPTVGLLCAAALVAQSALDGVARFAPYPHYYCGTWAAAVVCMWAGLRSMGRWGLPVGVIYAAALVGSTAGFVADIHRDGDGAVWHGPTWAAQQKTPGDHPGLR